LDWLPNLDGLKLFLEKVHQVGHDVKRPYKLIIAGRNSSSSNLQLPKGNDIDYLGEIADAELFWNKIDLLIVPLLSGSGVRIKILEAMTRCKIVLTTSIGVEGIPAQNGQEAIIEDKLENWPSILDKINNNRSAYQEMRLKAKTLIEQHYDENLIAARVVEYYRRITKEYS
jgi:glycosyltransferase involved in cell wall biosynthesis